MPVPLEALASNSSPASGTRDLPTQGVTVSPGFQAVTLIANVPLSTAHWQPFAKGEIVAVSAGTVTPQVA